MGHKVLQTAVLILVSGLFTVSAAQAQLTPERLNQLIQEERFEEAWELALAHRAELEGEIMFDFLYGVAAVNSGHVGEGVFALERVVMRRPGFTRARLELARAYYLRGEDARASHHFEIARSQDPPPPVIATIERYEQRIRARADRYTTTITGQLEIAGGNDSNINAATSNETVEWALSDTFGDLTLDDDSQAQRSSYLRTGGHVHISRPVNPDQTVFLRGDGEVRTHHGGGSEFDTDRVGLRAGTTWHGDLLQTTVAFRTQQFRLDGERYQDMNGVSLGFNRQLSPVTMANVGLQHMRMRYDDRPDRDADLTLLSAGVTRVWQARWRPTTSLGVFTGHEDAQENTSGAQANTDRNMHGVNAALRLQLDPEWSFTARGQYRYSGYSGENSVFGETRKEDYYQLTLDLDWAPSASWRIGPRVQYTENDANIELFEYDRTVYEIRARYSFY